MDKLKRVLSGDEADEESGIMSQVCNYYLETIFFI